MTKTKTVPKKDRSRPTSTGTDGNVDCYGQPRRPFICPECGARFVSSQGLRRHQYIHRSDKTFQCKWCDYKCARTSHLNQHMVTHLDRRPFACVHCGKCFKLKQHLTFHLFTHFPEQKPFGCDSCAKKFVQFSHLKEHVRSRHLGGLKLCSRNPHNPRRGSFPTLKNVAPAALLVKKEVQNTRSGSDEEEEEEVHARPNADDGELVHARSDASERVRSTGDEEMLSSAEGKVPSTADDEVHVTADEKVDPARSDRSDDEMPAAPADEEKRSFLLKEQVSPLKEPPIASLKRKPGRPRKKEKKSPTFRCHECGAEFHGARHTAKQSLQRHLLAHTGEKPLQCNFASCNFKCARTSHLNQHMVTHRDHRPFACHVCAKSFKLKQHLSFHLFMHFPDRKPFRCEECPRTFVQSAYLEKHVRKRHPPSNNGDVKPTGSTVRQSNQQRFPCDRCGKSFECQQNLSSHLFVHSNATVSPGGSESGERPLPQCPTAASSSSGSTSSLLLLQPLLKTREQHKYECHLCGAKFAMIAYLYTHRVTQHGNNGWLECRFCGRLFRSEPWLQNHIHLEHSTEK